IVSDYPPQFVYASAANVFLASDDACWIKCINVLASAVQKGLVALGDAGEMATRIILIRAMQQTTPIPCSETSSSLVPHGYSVRLGGSFSTTFPGLITRPTQPTSWSFCTEALRFNVSVGSQGLMIFLPSISNQHPNLKS
ncbi:uncharacterized protein VP01_9228g2, partial [Puccinia sorghi]